MQISVCFARALGALALALTTVSSAAGADIPDHGAPIVLFNGHDLNNFDIFLKSHGLNNDPDQVFRVERGIIHISGKEFGYIITKQEFANYYLRAEFKWGEGTYAPRQGKARDSGILYNVRGPQKVWPTSIEFQRMPSMSRRVSTPRPPWMEKVAPVSAPLLPPTHRCSIARARFLRAWRTQRPEPSSWISKGCSIFSVRQQN